MHETSAVNTLCTRSRCCRLSSDHLRLVLQCLGVTLMYTLIKYKAEDTRKSKNVFVKNAELDCGVIYPTWPSVHVLLSVLDAAKKVSDPLKGLLKLHHFPHHVLKECIAMHVDAALLHLQAL